MPELSPRLVLVLALLALLGRTRPVARFRARLEGAQEVPPVPTAASGEARLVRNAARTRLRFRVEVENIRNVTVAHIHLGRPGVNGPVVAFLFGPVTEPVDITARRVLASGEVTAADLVGPLEGRPLADLMREIEAGNAYVNVHTTQFPDGEIRGQLLPVRHV